MGRVFRRGELKQAILVVVDALGESHGYAIMGELERRVGSGWKPSPGAIYPALLALVDSGHLTTTDHDGTRMYQVTDIGAQVAESSTWTGRWAALNARAEDRGTHVALGTMLDRFADESPLRRRLVDEDRQRRIDEILTRAHDEMESTLEGDDDDG